MLNTRKKIYSVLAFLSTGLNGVSGLMGIFLISRGEIFWPLRLIIIGAGFDVLDGYFARKSEQNSRIGVYMDSFADEITYVILPSYWLIFISHNGQLDIVLELSLGLTALIYFSCGSYRLKRFLNYPTLNYFNGLPSSIAAFVVGSLNVLILTSPSSFAFFVNIGFHVILFLIIISMLMIKQMKYPSHVSFSHSYNGFRIVGYLLISGFVIFPSFILSFGIFLFFLFYTIIGPYFINSQKF